MIDGGAPSPGVESAEFALCSATQLTPVAAVSSPNPKQPAANAIDGNTGTRWESAYSDPQWIYVDLGSVKTITEVRIDWQHAAAKDYHVDVSNDAVTWSAPIASKTGMPAVDHRIDDLTGLSASGRYVRVYGTARATVYGYSIWELAVFGYSACTPPTNLLTAGWDHTNVVATFTPVAGFTFGPGKNAISLDYTSLVLSGTVQPKDLEFTQTFTVPTAGTQWRLTLTISGMNDQANLPPEIIASMNVNTSPSTYSPSTTQVFFSQGGRFINAGVLSTGTQLTADFNVSFAVGDSVDLFIDDIVPVASNGQGLQKFNITDASFVRLN